MMHDKRTFSIAPQTTPEALADLLTAGTQLLCSGFEVGDLLLLNDSFSENGAQEYAVIRNGRQIESLTASWMTYERLLGCLEALLTGPYKDFIDMGPATPPLDRSPDHRCPRCA